MTTTDAEEVHRLRQRLEKSEATRAKLRASLIALKASVSARAPALEAAGRPAAPDRGKGGIETSEREKNETSAPSAVSVAALLA
eukprot:CAMPEP_0203010432 /NCGR_PEP_ID=MMETSP1401-20130829/10697_1 /ASSEMBLY_ACC=CAM_ASM_000894 /TAXON_ID=38833 /ORGANISM="Micromonas pusilla, Strain CCAC1681" /LENGTH=83 /DNA_ID=CAMNT_0049752107 /DNA_START=73 /DNA_END=321 /DNA_ORIENTATION=-